MIDAVAVMKKVHASCQNCDAVLFTMEEVVVFLGEAVDYLASLQDLVVESGQDRPTLEMMVYSTISSKAAHHAFTTQGHTVQFRIDP